MSAVDFSEAMVADARSTTRGYAAVTVSQGSAAETGLRSESVDVVFSRALIHHLDDWDGALREARRILRPGGCVIWQNRTLEDCARPGSSEHIRGYFFEVFPHLLTVEAKRRPKEREVQAAMTGAGFEAGTTLTFQETRKVHPSASDLADELRSRTGHSLLHELTGSELEHLIEGLLAKLPERTPITEKDRWTVWTGWNPVG